VNRPHTSRAVYHRRLRVAIFVLVVVFVLAVASLTSLNGGRSGTASSNHPNQSSSGGGHGSNGHRATGPASIEAGVEPWQLGAGLSRESLVDSPSGLTALGGLTPSGSSTASVVAIDPTTGSISNAGTLATPVHDGAAAVLNSTSFDFGGGSPTTVASIQSFPLPSSPPVGSGTGLVSGSLPQPRSDLAVTTISTGRGGHATSTSYIVGGYDGTNYLPEVLATTDGSHFTNVANVATPVRYPAVASLDGKIYAFGGQTASAGSTTTATDDIQMIDPATKAATIIGHLPQAIYGAAAVVLDGTIYVAGGQVPGGTTLTDIDAFVPATSKVLNAGLLPQAVAFAGYATIGAGTSAVGYLVGGEVTSQSGKDQAGMASGSLRTILSLRPSGYGGPAGVPGAGAPFTGTFLIADRGNDRLLAMDSSRNVNWQYPSATMPPPAGGFYFPDDSFFFDGGSGIISNQEDNHTIVEIGYPSGKVLWQYGHPKVSGSGAGYLNQPDDAYLLKSGIVTVADASNNRILFISPGGQITGQIGNDVDAHRPPTSIAYPNGDTPLADGNVLVSEINGSWIDEYTPTGTMVWSVQMQSVNYPSDPQQLGADLYLMTDYNPPGEGRVLEFNRAGTVSWLYDAAAGDAMLNKPSLAERLPNGLIMVNDDYRDRVIAIDPATDSIVWQYGLTDTSGTAPGLLAIPDGFDLLLADGTTPTHLYTR
jgi:PQQ-like domain/Kelch motif